MMIKRKRVGLMALFPLETIILHRVGTEYLPFSMVLQIYSRLTQGHPSQPQTAQEIVQEKKQHNKKKNDNNENYHRTKKNIFQAHIIRCYHCDYALINRARSPYEEIFLLKFKAYGLNAVRSMRLECQNKYFPYGTKSRLIRALLYTYPNETV